MDYKRLRATIAALVPECFVIRPSKPSMPGEKYSLFLRLDSIQYLMVRSWHMPTGRKQAYVVMNEECPLDMDNLKIIVTALASRNLLV